MGSQEESDEKVAFYFNVFHNKIPEVKKALEKNPLLVNANIYSSKPLVDAAHRGHLHMVELLLEHGADIDGIALHSPISRTALLAAARRGHLDVARTLLEHGASTDIETHKNRWFPPQTPAELAERNGNNEIAKLIKEYEAKNTTAQPTDNTHQKADAHKEIKTHSGNARSNFRMLLAERAAKRRDMKDVRPKYHGSADPNDPAYSGNKGRDR